MTLLRIFVQNSAAHALGWALFHSLWQGLLAALALAAALATFRSSRARYAAACVILLAMLVAFGLIFARVLPGPQLQPVAIANAGRISPLPSRAPFPNPPADWRSILTPVLPWLAPFWICGVVIFHLRGFAAWLAARRLRRTGVCCPPDPWPQRLHRLAARLRLSRPVVLLESCLVHTPVVIGHLRPVILIPLGVLANIPAHQVEAVLLHELAHIRRFDYLVNLFQTAVEGLFFYHPAIWWISRVIRAEREHCCDDLVVALSGDAHAYALALAQLEQNRSAALETALAATGGSLVKRIRRLLQQPEGPRSSVTPVLCAAFLTVAAALALTAWQSKPAYDPPQPAAPVGKLKPPVALLAQARPAPPSDPAAEPYRRWLNQDVIYIIDDRERAAYESLQTNQEREHFILQFWQRRDPTPGTVENEFKQEHYRRIQYANIHFTAAGIPGWQTDRGRIYILYGPPDQIESHPSGGTYVRPPQEGGGTIVTYPYEDWLYRHIPDIGDNVVIEFVDTTESGDYRMTNDPSVKDASAPAKSGPADLQQRVRNMQDLAASATLRTGATVGVPANGLASLSVPLDLYGNHRVRVYLRVSTQARPVIHISEDEIQAPAPPFTKTLRIPPGSYQLSVIVQDVSTGAITGDKIDFEMK